MGDFRHIVLCQAPQVVAALEGAEDFGIKLRQQSQFDLAGYKMVHRSSTQYGAGRVLHEYLAIKLS
jgi:hypothetical protein